MNKKFLLLTTCIVAVILAVVAICVFVSGNYYLNIMDTKMNDINIKLDNLHIHNSDLTYNIETKDVIPDKETAIEVGTAILKTHFPGFFEREIVIDAVEENGVWKVYEVETWLDDISEEMIVLSGEPLHVELRKSNGAVLSIAK